MKNIVLIGGGDQAHYTIDIIHKQCKYKIVGIIDAQEEIGSIKLKSYNKRIWYRRRCNFNR